MDNIIFLALGLIIGSFLAALTYRYAKGISISKGFSFCDKCKKPIRWYENIPVISYIFLQGQCARCKKKISLRYPIIEAGVAIGFLLIVNFIPKTPLMVISCLFIFCILAAIFIIDFEHQIIPDDFVFIGVLYVFTYRLLIPGSDLYSFFLAAFLASGFLALIFLFTLGRGMGLGDVKFAVLGGLVLGINNLFIWMLLSFVCGAIIGILLILFGNAKLKDKIAFGPFLILAMPLTYMFGQKILGIMSMGN
jgi:leader peptidase (prepilin peptidase) / N-methyltransferase